MPRTLLPTLLAVLALASPGRAQPPNVLLIAVDDLNDWIGCLGGHPQAQTPNIDRLAARGVLFANAHCQSPVCNPSRASMMTSLYPATTGIYFLSPGLGQSAVARKNITMTMRFAAEDYAVAGAGKIFQRWLHPVSNSARVYYQDRTCFQHLEVARAMLFPVSGRTTALTGFEWG